MIKKIKEDYRRFKLSGENETFTEWYLKRVSKDSSKVLLAILGVLFGIWLIYDLSRVLKFFLIIILLSLIIMFFELLTRKK